jgi:hypothetical protein
LHFVGSDFDASELVVVVETDAELAEAERTKSGFGALDESEALGCDLGTVGKARGKAGGGGTVPGGKTGALGELADLGFGERGVEKRSEDLMLGGGTMAGAEVERVIGVDAVGDRGEVSRFGEGVEGGEEFVLAEIAAVGVVGAVGGILHFARFDEFVVETEDADEVVDDGAVVGGVAWRKRGDRKGAGAKGLVGGPSKIGGIGTARERDDDGREFGKALEKKGFLFFRRENRGFGIPDLNECSHFKREYIAELGASQVLRRGIT